MPAHACSSCEQLNPWAAECERRGERSAAGGRRRGLVVVRRPALEEPALEEPALEEPALEEAALEELALEELALEELALEELALEELALGGRR